MADEQLAARLLGELHDLGVTVALDDFGTGYSSLSHLHRLPIDRVKIDRSFVARLSDDEGAAAIVSGVVGLSESLGLGVVAEGVETAAQLAFLRELGCDAAQGYLLGRPQPGEECSPPDRRSTQSRGVCRLRVEKAGASQDFARCAPSGREPDSERQLRTARDLQSVGRATVAGRRPPWRARASGVYGRSHRRRLEGEIRCKGQSAMR